MVAVIEIHKKYGCLTVLDMGEEYMSTKKYQKSLAERDKLVDENSSLIFAVENYMTAEKLLFLQKQKECFGDKLFFRMLGPDARGKFYRKGKFMRVDEAMSIYVRNKVCENRRQIEKLDTYLVPRYKCQCKCGRLHSYTAKTIETKPKYCYCPIVVATKPTYDNHAANATHRRREKYKDIECVELCDRFECIPDARWCDLYNLR